MLLLGRMLVKHAVQRGIWVPSQHLLWYRRKPRKTLTELDYITLAADPLYVISAWTALKTSLFAVALLQCEVTFAADLMQNTTSHSYGYCISCCCFVSVAAVISCHVTCSGPFRSNGRLRWFHSSGCEPHITIYSSSKELLVSFSTVCQSASILQPSEYQSLPITSTCK